MFSTFAFESFSAKLKNNIISPKDRAEQFVNRFFLRKFVASALYIDGISEKTKNPIKILLCPDSLNIPDDMSQGHYFVGIGIEGQRLPDHQEIRLLRQAHEVIDEETIIHVHQKAVIHGAHYQAHDNINREFCNSIVYCESGFFFITKFLSHGDGGNTVAGFICKNFQFHSHLYHTHYISRVTPTQNLTFISYHDAIVPGMIYLIDEKYIAIPVSNTSSVD